MQILEEEVSIPKPPPQGLSMELPPPMQDIHSSPVHEDDKKGYIRKVYGIVTMQLFITFSLAYLASISPGFGAFCAHPVTIIISFIFMLIGMVSAMFLRGQVPLNYAALFIFTLSMGFIVSGCTANIPPDTVLTAVFVTLLMSFALTIYAWTAGKEAVVTAFFIIIFGMFLIEFLGLALFFTRLEWLYAFYCSSVALFYGCYLVIHTYVIREEDDVDDYIVAAIIIYMDIIRIFLYVLAALAKKK